MADGARAEEDFGVRRWRSYRVDVAGKRLSNGRDERIDLRLSTLPTEKPQGPTGPVDLIETQRHYFATAHSIDCKQQQDCTVADIARPVGIDIVQHALHVGPARGVRQRLLSVEPGTTDRSGQAICAHCSRRRSHTCIVSSEAPVRLRVGGWAIFNFLRLFT